MTEGATLSGKRDLAPILAGLDSKSPRKRQAARRALQRWLDEARRQQDGEARVQRPEISYSGDAFHIRIRLTRGRWLDLPDEVVASVYEEVAEALRGLADSFDALHFEN